MRLLALPQLSIWPNLWTLEKAKRPGNSTLEGLWWLVLQVLAEGDSMATTEFVAPCQDIVQSVLGYLWSWGTQDLHLLKSLPIRTFLLHIRPDFVIFNFFSRLSFLEQESIKELHVPYYNLRNSSLLWKGGVHITYFAFAYTWSLVPLQKMMGCFGGELSSWRFKRKQPYRYEP